MNIQTIQSAKNVPTDRPTPWREALDDLMRGVAGAFLFGAPLLYTMEVWWKASFISPARMLFGLALTYGALVALDRALGFRAEHASTWSETLSDSAIGMAIGTASAACGLLLIRQITTDMALDVIVSHIILEAIPCSIGVGIANGLLQQDDSGDEEQADTSSDADTSVSKPVWQSTLADAGATALGATVIAFSIAPTDEVPMIASALTPAWLLALVAASLLLSYIIVFVADFVSRQARQKQEGLLQSPLSETVFSYVLSLIMAAVMLWFFQLLRISDPLSQWISYTIVLGLPATIGGAAGRLTI